MTSPKIRTIFIIASMVLILVVLGFTGGLNLTSFKQSYTSSLISSYSVLAGETVRKVEYAVKYGKPLDNFYGIEELLGKIRQDAATIEAVQVAARDGAVMYDENGSVRDRKLPSAVAEQADFAAETGHSYRSVTHEGKIHVLLPVRDKDGGWIGTLDLSFGEHVIQSKITPYITKLVITLLVLALLSAACLVYVLNKLSFVDASGQIRKRRLLTLIFIVLGVVQALFGTTSYVMLKDGFLASVKENTSLVIHIIQRDIGYVVDKGVPYSSMYGVGDYMNRIIESVPEIDRISIMNSDFTTAKATADLEESKYSYSVPMVRDVQDTGSYLTVVDLSQSYINGRMRDILLDMMTMVIISFVVMVEITLFVLIILRKKVTASAPGAVPVEADAEGRAPAAPDGGLNPEPALSSAGIAARSKLSEEADRSMIRPLGFLVFASVYISTAFVPVLMKKLYEPLFGLSETLVLGLPISAEMLSLALFSMLAGTVIDRKGWKTAFMIGAGIIAAGSVFSALAASATAFIGARAIVGAGFGFALMAMQAFVVTAPTEEAKNDGLTELNSGAYAGMNCGVVVGAMLGDRLGYSEVFYVALALIVLGGLFAGKLMPDSRSLQPARAAAAAEKEQAEGAGTFGTAAEADIYAEPASGKGVLRRFVFNREIVQLFLLVLIPVSVCGMFASYFFPVYAESIDISSSDVGRVFLLNGLCIVFLGPLLSRLSEQYLGTRQSFVISNVLVVGALLLFAAHASLFTAISAVVLLGIAEGVGITSQINYYISRRATSVVGEGKAMGIYSLVENMGQMLGPLVFGFVSVFGMAQGVGTIGAAMFVLLALFMMLSREKKRADSNYKALGRDL
ncbi:MFS transporter [Paenibacillus sp. y28]|uniref:MFS transporter n=1 Tax=Paenibacillus sp. y28 TaxID=3129110 RepID=UPI0030185F58